MSGVRNILPCCLQLIKNISTIPDDDAKSTIATCVSYCLVMNNNNILRQLSTVMSKAACHLVGKTFRNIGINRLHLYKSFSKPFTATKKSFKEALNMVTKLKSQSDEEIKRYFESFEWSTQLSLCNKSEFQLELEEEIKHFSTTFELGLAGHCLELLESYCDFISVRMIVLFHVYFFMVSSDPSSL